MNVGVCGVLHRKQFKNQIQTNTQLPVKNEEILFFFSVLNGLSASDTHREAEITYYSSEKNN